MNEIQKKILRLAELLMKKYNVGCGQTGDEHFGFGFSGYGFDVSAWTENNESKKNTLSFQTTFNRKGGTYNDEEFDGLLKQLESEVKEIEKNS